MGLLSFYLSGKFSFSFFKSRKILFLHLLSIFITAIFSVLVNSSILFFCSFLSITVYHFYLLLDLPGLLLLHGSR